MSQDGFGMDWGLSLFAPVFAKRFDHFEKDRVTQEKISLF